MKSMQITIGFDADQFRDDLRTELAKTDDLTTLTIDEFYQQFLASCDMRKYLSFKDDK